MRPVFEPQDTISFTLSSSVAPDAPPRFAVYTASETLASSMTAVSSDTTHFYALYTTPSIEGAYVGEWFAQKTFNSTVYDFTKRFAFTVQKTRVV